MYKESDTKDNVITFESGDSSSFDSWTDIDILESGETHKSIFKKLSTMIKNVRYLYKLLGTDDISKIGNGTVRGALCSLNTETSNLGKSVADGKALLASTISAWGNPTASDATFEVLNTNMAAEFAATRDAAYSQGVAAADGRAAPGTVNYQSGYNQGVADADGRANSNSANWQNGHSVGYQAGVAAELNAIAGAWTTHGTVTGRLYMYIVEHNDSGYIWNTCNMANLSWVPGNVNEVYGYGTDGIKVEIFCIDGAAVSLQDFDAWLYGRNAYPSGFPVWKIKHTWSWVL
ncbi:hypothetical protein AALB52_21900 [Lachnospiraceae bacterium 38-14]